MNIVRYLPSAQFVVIVGSILLSGGLVVAAQQITHRPASAAIISPTLSATAPQEDWQTTLQKIEGSKIQTPDQTANLQETTQNLLNAAQSSNVTDTVARSLFINLSAAKSQGLGSDIPTQEALVAQAAAQIDQDRGTPTYTQSDIIEAENSPKALKAYGNAVITAIFNHVTANYGATIYTLATSTDNNNPAKLALLTKIGAEYSLMAKELAKIPTPATLVPLHLQILNDISRMAGTYPDMKAVFEDPLRGLAGLQLYDGLNNELVRVFTNIAQVFSQDGILFNKDEPGYAWGSFLSSQQ